MSSRFFAILISAFLMGWFPHASAQSYPSQPIKLVVPYAVGGGTDTMGRILGTALSQVLGQPVVIENRGGAGGNIGAAHVAQAAADGYTLLFTLNGITSNASLYQKLPFDVREFVPISLLAYSNYIIVVNPKIPAQTLPELVEYAKKNPGILSYASGGSGGPDHLAMELFKDIAKVDIVHVPYKGSGPGLTDTVAGNTSISVPPIVNVLPFIRSGRVRPLAGISAKRSSAAPEIPAVGDYYPGFDVSIWYGVLAPKGTPPAIAEKLNAALLAVMKSPEVVGRFKELGVDIAGTSSAEFKKIIEVDLKKWADLVQQKGLKLD